MQHIFKLFVLAILAVWALSWRIPLDQKLIALGIIVAVGICFSLPLIREIIQAFRIRRMEEAAGREHQLREEAARRAQQLSYQTKLFATCDNSLEMFESIPKHLLSAEQLLDVGEAEFREGAFSPFWDSIEGAIGKLAAIDKGVKFIADQSEEYKTLANLYNGKSPPFPIDPSSVRRVGFANATSARLRNIVRNAQRDFHFATIFEQRKTNQILIAGFANLNEAIHGVGDRLDYSIENLGSRIIDLSSTMTVMNDKVVDAIHRVSAHVEDLSSTTQAGYTNIAESDKKVLAIMENQATRQESANKMLDNIQRHRVPPIEKRY
jgi:hypothetical protein